MLRPRHLRSQSVRRPAFPLHFARERVAGLQIVSVAVGWQIYELSGSALTWA